ncbi:hypothetical protein MARPU_09355 [Marichromatium purpuratum 984]|uniref:Uncharacterized protein n=1 Tax=Marichromatium purpuratum 984 TaxID=765910 RepID=W0E7J1_MARPU|nr:hypothetical protein MARPU_09355 [Marichromatium purpuratum 984]
MTDEAGARATPVTPGTGNGGQFITGGRRSGTQLGQTYLCTDARGHKVVTDGDGRLTFVLPIIDQREIDGRTMVSAPRLDGAAKHTKKDTKS